jgi:hypothetical protein
MTNLGLCNRPNPFVGSTRIRYSLASAQVVAVTVFDVAGRMLATPLRNERQSAGTHEIDFNGRRLETGVYLCRVQPGNFVQTRKLLKL